MRSLVLAAALVAALSAPAHAMGRYVTFRLVAWNPDGTAAILMRDSSSSGTVGSTHDLLVIGARDDDALVFTFDDTQDADSRDQKIDVATCRRTAVAMRRALSVRRFRGIELHPERCKTDRAVVSFTSALPRDTAEIGDLSKRPAITTLELGVEAALTAVLGEFPADADVESLTGKLIVVLSGVNGDESGPAHVRVIAETAAGARILVDDLR